MRTTLTVALMALACVSPGQFSTTLTKEEKEAAAKRAQAAPVDPKLDRSGEARLRALFEQYGKLGAVHVYAARYNDDDGSFMTRNGDVDFYRSADGRWRFVASSIWSDSFLAVGGKDAVLVDELTSRPQILLDPAETMEKVVEVNGVPDRSVAVMWLMAGPAAFDKLVVKTAPVTAKAVNGTEQIEFKHPRAGVVRLTIKGGQVTTCELFPDFGATKNPTQRDFVTLALNPAFPAWAFDTTPTKGQALEDRRKKKA